MFDFNLINPWIMLVLGLLGLVVLVVGFLATRYKRCPSDSILVIYGKIGGETARCIHGGGALVWPLIQDCAFLSLTPMTINIPLQNALSMQNIRINVPSTFTVGISTDPAVMMNAAERLLGLRPPDIEGMAREIIFGQLRLTVASLTIEQINQDRESFLTAIRQNVGPELNKIGLMLINVNITDITDASDYILSIGKKAASEAINRAMVDVAEQDKFGAIGQAEANREKEIRVAESLAAAEKGMKTAMADQRIIVQQQETLASVGEAVAHREREIKVAENEAEAAKGIKAAEASRRIYLQQQEAEAVQGENLAKANIAEYEAGLAVKQAHSMREGEVAKLKAIEEIQKSKYAAEAERLRAQEIAQKEIDRQKIEIAAAAEAERIRRVAKGEADAVLLRYEAEAEGIRKVLESKAAGYLELVKSCEGDAKAAATLLMVEKIEEIVKQQVEAVKNLKIDKITVWDSGANGDSSTANFMSSLIRTLPPIQEIANMAGVELPEYLGRMKEGTESGKKATPSDGA